MITKEREQILREKHGCDRCANWRRRSDKSPYYCYSKPEIPTWWRCNNLIPIAVNEQKAL